MTRHKSYKGFGTALEIQGRNVKWYHLKWVAGPCYAAQQMLRKENVHAHPPQNHPVRSVRERRV